MTSLAQPQTEGVQHIVVDTPSFSSLFQDDLFVLFVSDSPLWQKFQTLVKFYNSLIQVCGQMIKFSSELVSQGSQRCNE